MLNPDWSGLLKSYMGADIKKSIFQLALTLTSYLIIVILMFFFVLDNFPYWYTLLLSIPAAGFQVNIFIIMHDCCHSSFFRKSIANSVIGNICGIITFTPFFDWRRSHAIHHASVSNLEKRGTGDVWTMTVDEYRKAPNLLKLKYRIFRNPIFLFGFAPVFLFVILYRLPHRNMQKRNLYSIIFTDIMLGIIIVTLGKTLGYSVYLKVFIPIISISCISGTWLFFIQHQFKNVYWSHTDRWDRVKAAMEGSSFYKLPVVLRWFTGNIGYHHIHHLNPGIPNYKLRKCYNNVPAAREIIPIKIIKSLKSLFLYLWDEESGQLVNYKFLKIK